MSEQDQNTIHQMILDQLRANQKDIGRVFDKLDEQGQTLARLTTTVEIHQKYSENLEKEQKANRREMGELRQDFGGMKTEVDAINTHVTEVKVWMNILKPTKAKALILAIFVSLLGGPEVAKMPIVKEAIKSYLLSPTPKEEMGPKKDASSAHE